MSGYEMIVYRERGLKAALAERDRPFVSKLNLPDCVVEIERATLTSAG
jgi:hypothetical protein